MHGSIPLAQGEVALERDQAATLRITPPPVRARAELKFAYTARQAGGGAIVVGGESPVHVFPTDLPERVSRRLGGRRLIVWDEPLGLPRLLAGAGVPFQRVSRASHLELRRADLLLVGPGQIDGSPFAQTALLDHAAAGTSVFVFAQTRPPTLAGYALAARPLPPRLLWRRDHPLFRGFSPGDLDAWSGGAEPVFAIQLPADEPVLELAWWPPESHSSQPAPIDALLVVKARGASSSVNCRWGPGRAIRAVSFFSQM